MRLLLILSLSIILTAACNTDEDPIVANLATLMDNATNSPSKDSYNAYFNAVNDFLVNNKDDKQTIKPILEQASKFATDQSQHGKAIGYLTALIKTTQKDCQSDPATVLTLAQSMRSLNKTHAASVIYSNYKEKNPSAAKDDNLERLLTDLSQSPTRYIDTIFEQVFRNPDQFGLNRSAALQFVDVAEAQALSDPCNPKSPDYLYRAGEIARSIRTLPKALGIYDWILEEYPDFIKTPTVYFLKGFILENNVEDKDGARKMYRQFVDKYPDHEMADDARFLLENLDKSDEQILEILEEKQKEKAAQNQ